MFCRLKQFLLSSPLPALPLGREAEAVPAGPGHAHSEDLPGLEVPQPVPAAEKEPDRGGGVVPPIRGEETTHTARNEGVCGQAPALANLSSLPAASNKRNTRRSRAPPPWCSPTPGDGRLARVPLVQP